MNIPAVYCLHLAHITHMRYTYLCNTISIALFNLIYLSMLFSKKEQI